MDWPNMNDLLRRFDVMLGVTRGLSTDPFNIIDVGCGVGLLLDYINDNNHYINCGYTGLDISEQMVNAARERHPESPFWVRDILKNPFPEASHDYVIMNGVLTEKLSLTQEEMEDYAKRIIVEAFRTASKGIAFNVMSNHVDWKRDDLFHWPLDTAVDFMTKYCSRNIVIRMDYGLYEYTIYLYKEPFHG
jgi:SAM-dependent methyltransferase